MHIAPFDNANKPLVDVEDSLVPLTYFNIVKLKKGQAFSYQTPGYETCVMPATGTVDVSVEGETYNGIGIRTESVWDGEPEGVYVPSGAKSDFVCVTDSAEIFVAGAKFEKVLDPFAVRAADIDMIQYGSDKTKTHRKIKHILGTKYGDKVGRLLVSELFTVGAGGWSGFPSHKHDTDRLPEETLHNEAEIAWKKLKPRLDHFNKTSIRMYRLDAGFLTLKENHIEYHKHIGVITGMLRLAREFTTRFNVDEVDLK